MIKKGQQKKELYTFKNVLKCVTKFRSISQLKN